MLTTAWFCNRTPLYGLCVEMRASHWTDMGFHAGRLFVRAVCLCSLCLHSCCCFWCLSVICWLVIGSLVNLKANLVWGSDEWVCMQLANLLCFLSSLPSCLMSIFGSIQPSKQILLSADTSINYGWKGSCETFPMVILWRYYKNSQKCNITQGSTIHRWH